MPDDKLVVFSVPSCPPATWLRSLWKLRRTVCLRYSAHDVGQLRDRATGELAEQRAAIVIDFERPCADQVLVDCTGSVSAPQTSALAKRTGVSEEVGCGASLQL